MKLVINQEYNHLSDWIKNIPSFFQEGKTIYKSRNEIKIFDTNFGKIVVKSFKIPHIANRFVYSFLRLSKAERSYAYSLEILKRGFGTPSPVAYIERFKAGLLSDSYYVSTYSDGLLMRNFNFIEKLTEEDIDILKAFARFTARLHEKEVYHQDYSPGNILYKKSGETILFDLIDVNRVQFKKVTGKMAGKALCRLEFSNEIFKIIAEEYALQRGIPTFILYAGINELTSRRVDK
ncbi:MAG: lipopolysaccharide kinase InaA family protein [Dysgonamonadaceae bacterium]|jgi:serine/threonine protein kinase|nr:lipopolysaccharide kinase InaA family protein [Dysgonamonadaceae bacterium]